MRFAEGPPGFTPLNPAKAVRKYQRHLPHWVQSGATYFVTFHLADSLPAAELTELNALRAAWQRSHPEPRSEDDWRELSRETMTRIEKWLDAGYGACQLREATLARLVGNALHHFHGQRYALHAWCVMPNHVHVLFRPLEGHEPEDILKSWKGFTARELNKRLARRGTLWQQESYDTMIRDSVHLAKAVRYIGRNPAKAGLPPKQWLRWIDPGWQRCGWGFEDEENDTRIREEPATEDFPA
jgi:putative transposase